MLLRRIRGDDGRFLKMVFVAEVRWREPQYLERAGLDVFEMIDWLGCRYKSPPKPAAHHPRTYRPGR